MNDLSEVKKVGKVKVEHSAFFEQYVVLLPKGNGNCEMHRFDTMEEVDEFIEKKEKKYWWMQ